MKTVGNLIMAASFLLMLVSVGACFATLLGSPAPMWLIAAFPGAFIAGLAGKVFCEAA